MDVHVVIPCLYLIIGILYVLIVYNDELLTKKDDANVEHQTLLIWVTFVACLWPIALIIRAFRFILK